MHVCSVVTKQLVEPDNLKLQCNNILSVQDAMFTWSSFEDICVLGCDIMEYVKEGPYVLEEHAALVPEAGDDRCVHISSKRLVYCTASHPRR